MFHKILLLVAIIIASGCTPEYKSPKIRGPIVVNQTPGDGNPDGEENPDGEQDPDGEENPDGEQDPDGEENPDGEQDPDGENDPDQPLPNYGRYQSCLEIHQAHPSFTDGYYNIDHDMNLSTSLVNVYCDMTNGGYTEIIGTQKNLNFNELDKMCDTSQIKASLYSDGLKGVGWGAGKGQKEFKRKTRCMTCRLFPFRDLKVYVSAEAKYQEQKYSKGYMWIPNRRYRNGWNVLSFNDRFKKDHDGSNELFVNTVKEINRFPIQDTLNYLVNAPFDSYGDLRVCLGGKKNFYYNKRFFKELRVR